MPTNAERVTVITPNYNSGRYVTQFLDSINKQTRRPDRLIFIDDGSTDNSVVLLQAATNVKKFYDIKIIISPQNQGPSAARNQGIKASVDNTEFFFFADIDDVFYPEKIKRSLEAMKDPSVGLVYSDYDAYNTKSKETKREFKESYSFHKLCNECIISTNSIIRAELLKKSGLYDEQLRVAEDWDLWLRICDHSMAYHIPESLFRYNITGDGATFSVKKDIWNQCWQRVRNKLIDRQKGGGA